MSIIVWTFRLGCKNELGGGIMVSNDLGLVELDLVMLDLVYKVELT
jgi:hypothetical protein